MSSDAETLREAAALLRETVELLRALEPANRYLPEREAAALLGVTLDLFRRNRSTWLRRGARCVELPQWAKGEQKRVRCVWLRSSLLAMAEGTRTRRGEGAPRVKRRA